MIFTAFSLFPVFGYIFSGFSNVNNRWGYIYVVIVSFILAESLDKMRDLSGKELGIMTAITGLYGLVNVFSDKLFVPSIYGAFGLLAATLIMLFLLNSDKITFSKKQFRGIVLGMTAWLFSLMQSGLLLLGMIVIRIWIPTFLREILKRRFQGQR